MSKKNFAKRQGRAVLPGQLWIDTSNIERRVMAVTDGYAMVRTPRCIPFVVSVSQMDMGWRLSPGKNGGAT